MSAGTRTVAAVDLGASSGRVMVGRVGRDALTLTGAHRFGNRPVAVGGTLHWDILALYQGVLDGLRAAGQAESVGVDSWAVDYGLLDADGALLGNPVSYRDLRTEGIAEKVWPMVSPAELYAATGIQHAPFNTLYQLIAARGSAHLAAARTLLLIPDLIGYWLTGEIGTELTNASTTQLLDPLTRDWSRDLAARLDIDLGLFGPLRRPGQHLGDLLPAVLEQTGLTGPVPLTTVASHDTASAVAAVPAAPGERFAYICTGTWSLAGLELDAPVLTEAARLANFTNEAGIDGTVRFLRNIMGLWLLQECVREWESGGGSAVAAEGGELAGQSEWEGSDGGSVVPPEGGEPASPSPSSRSQAGGAPVLEPERLAGSRIHLPALLRAAAELPALRSVVDAADPAFLAPGHMTARIAEACRATGQPVPATPAEFTRCILDSLALAHRTAIRQAQQLADHPIDIVHIVGGGARNTLLCQLTADACGLPVVAGPAEAAALGNVLVQARALGAGGDRAAMRSLLVRTQPLAGYQPSGDPAAWAAAAARIGPRRSPP
ncbi:MAG: rhamnulokinase [Catenulispora sp.]|nr:rhamnulokinase [Catenulispora sp.]